MNNTLKMIRLQRHEFANGTKQNRWLLHLRHFREISGKLLSFRDIFIEKSVKIKCQKVDLRVQFSLNNTPEGISNGNINCKWLLLSVVSHIIQFYSKKL